MRKVDVVILVEHVARELDVACAVRHLLEVRHGMTVEILPVQTSADWAVKNLRPRVVAVHLVTGVGEPYVKSFLRRWPGVIVLSLAWEQLLYKAFADQKRPTDAFARDYVFHHAWGDAQRDRLLSYGVPEDHVFVNGQPAYGLYLPPYRDRFPDREELARRHDLDPARRWVLFPENYGWGFYPKIRIETLLRAGIPQEQIDKLRDFCRESLDVVLRWCATLAAREDVEVIIRPRPATLVSDFMAAVRAALPDRPAGLKVLKEGSVREWILASDTVFSSYSTTLIEAAVAGKRPFMVAPLPFVEDLEADWYEHVDAVTDEEAFLGAALDPEAAGIGDRLGTWARETLLSRGDPISGLAEHLATLADPDFERPPLPPRSVFPSRYRDWTARGRVLSSVRRGLRSAVGGDDERYVLAERKVPEQLVEWLDERDLFDSTDVEPLMDRWREVLAGS